MNHIYLTFREKRLLSLMRFKKRVKPRIRIDRLLSYRFIIPNYSGQRNKIGESLPDGTYSITDTGRLYFIQRREKFFTVKFPVIMSLIALIKSFWPELSALVNMLIETAGQSHP